MTLKSASENEPKSTAENLTMCGTAVLSFASAQAAFVFYNIKKYADEKIESEELMKQVLQDQPIAVNLETVLEAQNLVNLLMHRTKIDPNQLQNTEYYNEASNALDDLRTLL